ncbi:type 1 glutamine amidotransferase domain-containing protein [Ectothiorhodospiraceae bacterium WFHF3C12]|nr:type 1 glutamine amidotransferase domain-containing protein [Ectothiorhodospiraceae bacterium WFHF3C12]
MASNRLIFVVTNNATLGETGRETGLFLSEAAHPHRVLTEAGYSVDFVSPHGGPASYDPNSLEDLDDTSYAFYENPAIQQALKRSHRPEDVDATQYDGIFYAGGHGTMWDFPDSEALARLCTEIYERGGVVGAVCHGPAGLVNVRLSDGRYLVDGKEVACFTTEEEEAVGLEKVVPFLLDARLSERGARHTKAEPFQAHVVRDGRLVTGQNPPSATGVGEKMLEALKESG